jgi:antitoxin component HigA of HigAB toxin-antitoxin module
MALFICEILHNTTGIDLHECLKSEILLEEFLKPMGISAYRLAKDIGVTQMRISEILSGKRAITACSKKQNLSDQYRQY